MILQVVQNLGNFLTSWRTVRFWSRTLFHGVSIEFSLEIFWSDLVLSWTGTCQ